MSEFLTVHDAVRNIVISIDFKFFRMSLSFGQKCSYSECERSLRQNPGLKRFSFPVNDPERLSTWIINSGNTLLKIKILLLMVILLDTCT